MIIPKKSKFTKWEWSILKKYLEGHLGEIHHCLGKQYEKLAYLKVMTSHDHRGPGHHKHVHGMPEEEALENVAYWKSLLKEDYKWLEAKGLVCD